MMPARLEAHFLESGDTVLLGVSGGPDSLCLLHLARQVAGLKIIVAHFNHRLRPEADQEAEFVKSIASQLELPYVSEAADVRSYAEENKLSLEEAARMLRYRFLFAQAREKGLSQVAVGHTADDQVETILMHFLRGAGLAGLKGMTGRTLLPEFDREIPLVRPILHLWRTETEAYCRENGLQPVYDASNADEMYFRNRLRLSLIPELEKYNPRFKSTLQRTAQALAGDYEALTEAVATAWQKVVLTEEPDHLTFRSSAMEEIPAGLRRNIIRKAMEDLRPDLRNIDFDTLERASDFIDVGKHSLHPAHSPRRVDLSGGLVFCREGDSLSLAALEADLPTAQWPLVKGSCELKVNGQVILNENFALSALEVEVETARLFAFGNGDPYTAWVDAGLTGDRFTVRTRRSGDVFSPLGMDRQTVKLKEFYINVKMPKRARNAWPLVCTGDQIVWVPGYRLAHPFRINEKTKRVVKLTLQPA